MHNCLKAGEHTHVSLISMTIASKYLCLQNRGLSSPDETICADFTARICPKISTYQLNDPLSGGKGVGEWRMGLFGAIAPQKI
jgi:hypothetical protein